MADDERLPDGERSVRRDAVDAGENACRHTVPRGDRRNGLARARLRFTTESAEECVRVLRAYKGREEYTPKDITRGLFYRGVE